MKTTKKQMTKRIGQANVCLFLLLTTLFLSLSILHGETLEVYVGDPNSTEWSPIAPFTFDWESSLAQTIYTADELYEVGLISSIEYTYNDQSSNVGGSSIAVYMANIWDDIDTFTSNNSWIPSEYFTLVYDDVLPQHPSGMNPLTLVLDNPFIYQGGNLVIYTWKKYKQTWPMLTPFLQTKDEGKFRTIHIVGMSDSLHPLSPPSGQLSHNVPNITLSIVPNESIGHLSGIVTHHDVPLEGVRVRVNYSTRRILTDGFGQYILQRLPEGIISITVSKHGFVTQEIDNISIFEGEITTLNISMVSEVSVSGVVITSEIQTGIQGALVTLQENSIYRRDDFQSSNVEQYETTTDDMGQFLLENIYPDLVYILTISKEGYYDFVNTNLEVGTIEIELGNIVLYEKAVELLPPTDFEGNVESNTVTLSWTAPNIIPLQMEANLLGYRLYRDEFPLYSSLILETNFIDYDVPDGVHVYNLQAIYLIGESEIVSIEIEVRVSEGDEIEIPVFTELLSNFPNPFNPSTTIRYHLAEESNVKIDIFNLRGQLVETLINDQQNAGRYSVVWNAEDVPSGIYLYRLETNAGVEVKRMVLLK
ncbi:MAG: carboxypeptidase regulatory-like domain-containing protein [Candidatus Cloacimonetes bacterium]|nr:carboxypeptidase regulatory-like domain-containing protein [Candidatus Cloacimonadota bacterium]